MTDDKRDNQLRADLRVDGYNLDEDIMRQPGLFASYAEAHGMAEKSLRLAKLKAEVYEAALYGAERDKFVARGVKPSELQIRSKIVTNDVWRRHQEEVIDCEAKVDQVKAVVEAMRQKKDMLVTFSANKRNEIGSNFAMRGTGSEPRSSSNGALPITPPPIT